MSLYHKDTYEVLTRHVYNERVCHSTDVYLDRLWHTLNHYRPNLDAFIVALERAIQKCIYEIEQYPTDYANVNQCRDYIKRDREWLDRLPGISQRCEESERKNNEIMARLEELMRQSRARGIIEIDQVQRKCEPVQTALWEESA